MRPRLVAVLVFLLALPLLSQQPPTISETVTVRLVEVDVTVADRSGNPVVGLTADDFELFENGKPRPISNFSEYRETTMTAAVVEAAPAAPGETPAVERPAPRTIVLFIDVIPLAGPARVKLFDDLQSLVARTMREGDRAQVLQWDDRAGVLMTTPLTGNRAEIEQALAAAGNVVRSSASRGPTTQEYADFFTAMAEADRGRTSLSPESSGGAASQWVKENAAEQELAIMRRKTAAMQRILGSMAQPKGRNIFVYVSEGFPAVAGTRAQGRREADDDPKWRTFYGTQEFLEAVVAAANANGVSIYGLRPAVPQTQAVSTRADDAEVVHGPLTAVTEAAADSFKLRNDLEALSLVSEQTGGTWGVGPTGVVETIERVVRDAGSYYTLAYRAPSDGSDRQRRIEVRAKNRDYVVRTRRSVVEKSERTRRRDMIVARLFETGPAGDLEFEVKTGGFTPAGRGDTVLVPIELSFDAEQLRFESEGSETAAKFTVLAVAGGNLTNVGQVHEESQRVVAPQGKALEGPIRFNTAILHNRKPTTVAIALIDEKSGQAGTRLIKLGAGDAVVEELPPDRSRDPEWSEAKARALREHKPLVVYFRPTRCNNRCIELERTALPHPAIERRMKNVVFITLPTPGSEAARQWNSRLPGFAQFDHTGTLRVRWDKLPPDTTSLAKLLDLAAAAGPHFERAVAKFEEGPAEGELELAFGLSKLGRIEEARAAVERAIANGSPKTRQLGIVGRAMMDLSAGKTAEAMATLDRLIGEALTPEVAATAWMGIGLIHRTGGDLEKAITAYSTAVNIAGLESETGTSAHNIVRQLRELAAAQPGGPIRIVPFTEQLITGRRRVRTLVESAAVARVLFSVDGRPRATVEKPPFSAVIDFGRIPQAQAIRAVAQDSRGKELGRAELVVNNAGEMFWLRLLEPHEGPAGGAVRVSATMRTPVAHKVKRVVVTWNDAERAVMTAAPWQATVDVPKSELGILRAVAELDDGRTAEDAVLLNASGYTDRSDVPLVELPVTIKGGEVEANDIAVREGTKARAIESFTPGTEAPLTVGMLIDTSESMQSTMMDVQEAAIRFLDTALGPKDRAFLIAFDTQARLIQTPTSDRARLRDQILGLRPSGYTALHDAMILGLLQFEGVKGRRALVVFSDGVDRVSRYRDSDVAEMSRRSNIPIYIIAAAPSMPVQRVVVVPPPPARQGASVLPTGPGPQPLGGWPQWTVTITELGRVAESTGGRLHRLHDLAKLDEVYRQIAADLRAQSLVVIRTDPGKSENDWRKIAVDVAGRGDVRAPAGYYAPW